MRLDLISPPRLGVREAGVGRSGASWDITTGPKLRADRRCVARRMPIARLDGPRSPTSILKKTLGARPGVRERTFRHVVGSPIMVAANDNTPRLVDQR
jgi:hypothetical protein